VTGATGVALDFTTVVIGAAPLKLRDARPPDDSKHQHLENILKTYNEFLTAQYANQLHALEKLGAKAEFVVQDYGTQTAKPPEHNWGDGITPNSHFVNIERRVELRVTMEGSCYSLRWHRDSETLDAFDIARAASMAKRFVEDIDSLTPMLWERLEYMKAAKWDINNPINYTFFDTVYRGTKDIWDIQNHRIGNGINKLDDVLNAITVERQDISYVSNLEQLYGGSKWTCTMPAILNTVMTGGLVHTDTDYRDRYIYDVVEFEGLQIKVSYDEEGILFRPTYFGEGLPDGYSCSFLYLDGEFNFACEMGGESLYIFWEDLGCSFEEFDDERDPVTAFRKLQRALEGSGIAVTATAETAIA
jgi:hypothetical protein